MTDANRPGEGEPTAGDTTPQAPEPTAEAAPGAPASPDATAPAPSSAAGSPAEPEPAAAEPEPAGPAAEPVAASADAQAQAVQPPSYPPPPSPVATPPPPQPAAPAAVAPAQPPPAVPVRRRTWPRTLSRIVAFLFGILQALLIVRIVLLLLIANPDNEIVSAVLTITDPFVEPFRGMFQLDEVTGQRGSVLDIAAVVAFLAWTLIETLILSLLRLFDRPSRA